MNETLHTALLAYLSERGGRTSAAVWLPGPGPVMRQGANDYRHHVSRGIRC